MSDRWPVEFERDEYHPIPQSWLDHPSAFDRDQSAGPRLFAVSVAQIPGQNLRIRFAAVNGRVLIGQTASAETDSGSVAPMGLVNRTQWARSIRPGRNNPRDCLRTPEWDHFEELWSDRVDDDLELDRRERPLPANPDTASGGGVLHAE